MKRLDKERRKLEKVGFSGQTPSMALYEMETKTRELEAKLGLSPKEPF